MNALVKISFEKNCRTLALQKERNIGYRYAFKIGISDCG